MADVPDMNALAEQVQRMQREMAVVARDQQLARELSQVKGQMDVVVENQRKLMEQNKEIMRLLKKRPISPPPTLLRKAPSALPPPVPPAPKSAHMRALKAAKASEAKK
eukprot:6247955-Amphidinium_carterae.1